MKTEESLYIKILIWVYSRQESGFIWVDLKEEFQLTDEQEQWVLKIFRSDMPSSDNLIDHIYNTKTDAHRYFITAKGTSAAIQYLNLKEAESIGKRAEKIALMAIAIGIIVGIVQITIGIWFR